MSAPLTYPAQWCPRHELWWSGPYKCCPVCHMVQWYPEPKADPPGVRACPVSLVDTVRRWMGHR
jgi:hypothetical protein